MVCSFAKFLALGLIASDATIQGVSAEVNASLKEKYQILTGVPFPNADAAETTDAQAQTDLIQRLQQSYKSLKDENKTLTGTDDQAKITELTSALIDLWKVDQDNFKFQYTALAAGTSAEKRIADCKDKLLASLITRYHTLNKKAITGVPSTTTTSTWAKIQFVKEEIYMTRFREHNDITGVVKESKPTTTAWTAEILAVEKKITEAEKAAADAKAKAELTKKFKEFSTDMQQKFQKDWDAAETNDERQTVIRDMEAEKAKAELEAQKQAAEKAKAAAEQELEEVLAKSSYSDTKKQEVRKAFAELVPGGRQQFIEKERVALTVAATMETEAAAKKKAEEEAAERAEAVGGFFGVFLGLVGLTLGFLMSPCVQFDFNTGKTATNWATGTPDEEWTQMDMYKEAYKTDKTPGEWRDEVFGLPEEQPVDSAKATSSALTLVPVVVLAGGVFAVARRGLKRRAQKKAKRVSRAQQKLHEDL